MKVEVKDISAVEQQLNVVLSWEDVSETYHKVEKKLMKGFRLDGFRKGKVPKAIALRHLEPQIKYEFANDVINETYLKVIEEQGIEEYLDADITDVDFDTEKDFTYTIKIEKDPEVKMFDYKKGFPATKKEYVLDDEDVNIQINGMLERFAKTSEVEGETKEGHYLVCDIQELDEKGEPIPGNKAENKIIRIGEGMFGTKSAQALIGAKVGDEVNITVKDESGKDIAQAIKIHRIEEYTLPELTNEFVKEQYSDVETVDALKAKIGDELKKDYFRRADTEMQNEIMDYFVEKCEFDIPEVRMEKFLSEIVKEVKSKNQTAEMDESQIREVNKPHAEKEIRWFMIKKQLILDEEIKVEESDIEAEVEKMSQDYPESYRDQIKKFYKSKENQSRLEFNIEEKKLFEKLAGYAKIKNKKVKTADLRADVKK